MKKDENGYIVKHKARYNAKGFNQVFGSDYLETFAPTAKLSSIRLFLALAIHFSCEVFQFDVSSAYLNADLEGDVFVQQPPGFEFPNKDCGPDGSRCQELILDSGCTSHMFHDSEYFVELHDVSSKVCVNANNSVSPVKGQGVAKVSLVDKKSVSHVLSLSNCLYVPDHSKNLLSVSAFGQKGAMVVFGETCEFHRSDDVSLPFVERNGLYVTKAFSVTSSHL